MQAISPVSVFTAGVVLGTEEASLKLTLNMLLITIGIATASFGKVLPAAYYPKSASVDITTSTAAHRGSTLQCVWHDSSALSCCCGVCSTLPGPNLAAAERNKAEFCDNAILPFPAVLCVLAWPALHI